MADNQGAEVCAFCKRGSVVTRAEELAFHQSTSRGYIRCKVTIPMSVCERCGAKSWDEAAEALIEEAARREQDKLR